MKKIIKSTAVILTLFICAQTGNAIQIAKIQKEINNSELNKTSTVAVSIRKTDGNVVFEQNSSKLLHPASTIKVFTLYPSLRELGYDYNFKTEFYKDYSDNLYIKLGADPMLTTTQLKQAFSDIKAQGTKTFNNIYIDDGVLDKKEFAEGWMWDDDVNYYTPKVSSYNLDGNILNINMTKNENGTITTSTTPSYPIGVISKITPGTSDKLDLQRYNWLNPDVIEIKGNIKQSKTLKVPVSNMRKYFIHNVEKLMKDNGIQATGTVFASKAVPENAKLITSINNPVINAIKPVLQKSNNLYAETIYKTAGARAFQTTGTDNLAGEVFKSFYNDNGVKTDNISVKDGCGISRNNLFSADWMTQALVMLYKQPDFGRFKENMAQPGDGTLASRLHDLRGNAWLKTGSLSNVSAITGYVHSLDGSVYAVTILTQNFNVSPQSVKAFEDEIIKHIYAK